MEESTMTAQEQEQTSYDAFLAGFDDMGTEPAPADQPEAQAEAPQQQENTEPAAKSEATAQTETPAQAEQSAQPAETQQQADAPKQWTLRHMDESKTVGETEMVALAQKGMDYDRLRTKYDEFKPVMDMFSQFANKANMNTRDYIAHIRAQAMQAQGMSEAEAKRAVELEDREAAVAAQEAAETQRRTAREAAEQAQQAANARRQADIAEFQKHFPDAAKDPASIPQEVWAEVRSGVSLVTAYSKYALAQERAARMAAEQKVVDSKNQSNAARATGSMRSAGEDTKTSDPLLDGFDNP